MSICGMDGSVRCSRVDLVVGVGCWVVCSVVLRDGCGQVPRSVFVFAVGRLDDLGRIFAATRYISPSLRGPTSGSNLDIAATCCGLHGTTCLSYHFYSVGLVERGLPRRLASARTVQPTV